MRICINYCKNCGAEYKFQASGSWNLNTPEKFNDWEYCPVCKEYLLNGLTNARFVVPRENRTEVKWISTDMVTKERLLQWESEEAKEYYDNINGMPGIRI